MNYDITFCNKKNCKNKECKRNQANIKDTNMSIWISEFKECKSWEES